MKKLTLDEILSEIEDLQDRLAEEFRKKEKELRYKIQKRRVIFEKDVQKFHKKYSKSLFRYIYEAEILSVITAPVIYSLIFPALMLDLFVSTYQFICFPVYKIKKVKRRDYIIVDRHNLKYLNILERINCLYCGYVNGLFGYVQEIGGRTEQYWCPIKHARRIKNHHSRYYTFTDYGDAEVYQKRLMKLRDQLKELAD